MTDTATPIDHKTATALMDATERLLISHGAAGISTRRIAEEAGQPHGLVRYHFGSLEALMERTMEGASAQILQRQRALYGSALPFAEKWETAMSLVDTDLADGFPKIMAELFAKAWNEPAYRDGVQRTMAEFTEMLLGAVSAATEEYGVVLDDERQLALATLIRTFQIGILVERLAGVDIGHAALIAAIDDWLDRTSQNPDDRGESHARP